MKCYSDTQSKLDLLWLIILERTNQPQTQGYFPFFSAIMPSSAFTRCRHIPQGSSVAHESFGRRFCANRADGWRGLTLQTCEPSAKSIVPWLPATACRIDRLKFITFTMSGQPRTNVLHKPSRNITKKDPLPVLSHVDERRTKAATGHTGHINWMNQ